MRNVRLIKNAFIVYTIILFVFIIGCSPMSEMIRDNSVGINGGFEHIKNGLPVNWLVYTPKTVPEADFDLIIDSTNSPEGSQSLKFLVRECSSNGGWLSPGFSQEYIALPGQSYKISFWIKNEGTEFIVRVGGVRAHEGNFDLIVKSSDTYSNWMNFEYLYTLPSEFSLLRIELNILQPGTFWIDNIVIDGITELADY